MGAHEQRGGVVIKEHAVVIAGGGPTGLMLGGESALAGVDVAIVEGRASQDLAGSRAGGVHARTIEILDQRGIADRFLSQEQVMQIQGFGLIPLDISDFPSRHNYGLAINGCSVCLDLHHRMAKNMGESDERLFVLAGWRDAPYFTDAERAALALTEAVTRLSDRPDPVPDDIWAEAAKYNNEAELAALILSIAQINVWNRLNVATRQVAGEWAKSQEAQKWLKEHA
jgi:hypothetical protein